MMQVRRSSSLLTSKALHVRFTLRSADCIRCISSTPILFKEPPKEGEVQPEFYVPKDNRGQANIFLLEGFRMGDTRLERSSRFCPTRELNFSAEQWGKHKSPYRKLRHMASFFSSAPFQRLVFPDLTIIAAVTAGLTYYNEFVAEHVDHVLTMSSAGFTGATTAIGLLAGFKLNASYGRYEECRIFWGDINNTIRDLCQETMMWMKDADQRNRMLKLCQAFPMTHMFHLHTKGCHHLLKRKGDYAHSFEDRVHAEFMAELRDIYNDGTNEEDFQRLSKIKYNGGNTPLEVLLCMRETIAGSVGSVDAIYVRELDEQVQRLCAAYGASERVLRTPLPTGYSRLTSRLLFLWSNCLPFALYPALGPYGTFPAVFLTAYAVLSIEDVGVQLEEPFDLLPLRQYSDGMYDAVNAAKRNYTPYLITEK